MFTSHKKSELARVTLALVAVLSLPLAAGAQETARDRQASPKPTVTQTPVVVRSGPVRERISLDTLRRTGYQRSGRLAPQAAPAQTIPQIAAKADDTPVRIVGIVVIILIVAWALRWVIFILNLFGANIKVD